MVIVLALVVGCIYGVLAFVKTVRKPQERDVGGIRVLAHAQLAPGRSVHVVKAGSRSWLLGASDGSVSLISEIEDKEFIDRLELEADKEMGKVPAFQTLLSNLLPGGKAGPKKKEGGNLDFLSRQRDRVNKL